MKKISLLVLAVVLMSAVPAQAGGPLDLGAATDWLYGEIQKRGVIGTLVDWNGNKTVAGALNFGLIHNKAKTKYWAGLALGADVTADKVMKGRVLASPSINLVDISRTIWEAKMFRDHVTIVQPPADWQIWIGPWIRSPSKTWGEWTWKTHTGPVFGTVGKRFGGTPKEDFDTED